MIITNINPRLIEKILGIFSSVTDRIEAFADKIDNFKDSICAKDNISDQLPRTVVEKTEFVSLNDIKQLATAHKSDSSDGVAIALVKSKDKDGYDKVNLYMTYVKGRTIINNLENTLIIISAEAVSKEVKKLFADNDVIILN